MTKISKELLSRAGIIPKLRLGNKTGSGVVSTGPHRVKIIEDKIIKKPNNKGVTVEWVRYFVEENGEQKIYDTKLKNDEGQLSYLVQRFAEIPEGAEIILEMKKQGVKNYIQVTDVGSDVPVEEYHDDGEEVEEVIE